MKLWLCLWLYIIIYNYIYIYIYIYIARDNVNWVCEHEWILNLSITGAKSSGQITVSRRDRAVTAVEVKTLASPMVSLLSIHPSTESVQFGTDCSDGGSSTVGHSNLSSAVNSSVAQSSFDCFARLSVAPPLPPPLLRVRLLPLARLTNRSTSDIACLITVTQPASDCAAIWFHARHSHNLNTVHNNNFYVQWRVY